MGGESLGEWGGKGAGGGLSSLSYDWCHKKEKLIELSAQRVRGQTHPVRSRRVAVGGGVRGHVTCQLFEV